MYSESVLRLLQAFSEDKILRKYLGTGYKNVIKNSFLKEMAMDPKRAWSIADLEDMLRSSKSKKEKQRDILLAFYQYIEDVTHVPVETDLNSKIIIDDNAMRRIAIVKYLQNNRKTTAEMADVFMMTDRTMRAELRELEDGVPFMDQEFQIEIERKGWQKYMEWSRHPVFLNMTMNDVTAMTVGLIQASENNPLYKEQFCRMAKETYDNLTDYAKGRLRHLIQEKGMMSFFENEVETYERQLSSDMLTMFKAGCMGTLQVHHEENDYVYTDCQIVDYEGEAITIKTNNGHIVKVPFAEVFCCEYELADRW